VATLDGQPKPPPTRLKMRAIRRAESCRQRRHATKHDALVDDTSRAAARSLLRHGGADAARHRSTQRLGMSL
jgi:hypothetical protein